MDRFDFRQNLALLDMVILFDKETDDASRNHLGSDVDDMGLDKSVVGDGMAETVSEPVKAEDSRPRSRLPRQPDEPRTAEAGPRR